MVGSCSYRARAMGSCCAILFSCINLGSIIVAIVFRFNLVGQLAALSTKPNRVEGTIFGVPLFDSDGPTYQSDAQLIIVLLALQTFFCFTNYCAMGYAQRPPSNLVGITTDRQLLEKGPKSPEQPLKTDL